MDAKKAVPAKAVVATKDGGKSRAEYAQNSASQNGKKKGNK